jgi:hypothetical protein
MDVGHSFCVSSWKVDLCGLPGGETSTVVSFEIGGGEPAEGLQGAEFCMQGICNCSRNGFSLGNGPDVDVVVFIDGCPDVLAEIVGVVVKFGDELCIPVKEPCGIGMIVVKEVKEFLIDRQTKETAEQYEAVEEMGGRCHGWWMMVRFPVLWDIGFGVHEVLPISSFIDYKSSLIKFLPAILTALPCESWISGLYKQRRIFPKKDYGFSDRIG